MSTCAGEPVMDGLSSQKLALATPREGVMKMYAVPPIRAPARGAAELRFEEWEISKE